MSKRARALLLCASLAACSKDIQLGVAPDAAVDARPDIPLGTFITGPYTITFRDPSQVQCAGTLAGMEASFTSLTHDSLRILDGTVTLDMTSSTVLTITGQPMLDALAVSSVGLTLDTGAGSPVTWDVNVPGSFGGGPLSTAQIERAFAVNAETAGDAAVAAALASHFQTSDMMGDCATLFDATLVHQ